MALSDYLSYDYLFRECGDKRVEEWVLMKNPTFPAITIAVYLYSVYIALPKFMENRKPFDLKLVIQVYNIIQILSCIIIIYGVATSGWTTHYTLGCVPVDYSESPMAMRMLTFVWWTMMLKMLEMVETMFFVLRKKYNQVSKLHVYHHASTFLIGWIATKYIAGGMVTFPILLNSFIHVLMYGYYFLSALGPDVQKKIAFIKPKLTMMQMIQFCILLAHAWQAWGDQCAISNLVLLMFIPNVILIFGMFINFYIKQYLKKSSKKMA